MMYRVLRTAALRGGSLNKRVSQPIFLTTRSIFIDTERTPNPQSMKFLPDREVLPESYGTGMFFPKENTKEINRSPLVKLIFKTLPGSIKGVFLGRDFITVTKETEESWHSLKPMIYSAVLDFYAENLPIVEENPLVSDTTILGE
jgi:hypothetical protein